MTNNERKLITALEDDINTWETEARFFDTLVEHVCVSGGSATSGREYAHGLRQRIKEHKALIEKLKKS
jgi:pyruvate-formate lyase-activating enzyme